MMKKSFGISVFTVGWVGLLAASAFMPVVAEVYQPPTGVGAPARREGAGARGCVYGGELAKLIALMPAENVGWTTAGYPRFYWYLPLNQASFVQFTLETATGEMIYQTQLPVTPDSGVMSLKLPAAAGISPLQEGDRYRWQVELFCNPDAPQGELQVEGWVEHQVPEPELAAKLTEATGSEQIALYAQNGYWFDALDGLAQLQMTHPHDETVLARWTELLESVGLGAIAQEPVIAD
jgi:hypothetical protein